MVMYIKFCFSSKTKRKWHIESILNKWSENGMIICDWLLWFLFALRSPRVLMVMELMEGGELFELVRTKRRFTEKEAVNFTRQVEFKVSSRFTVSFWVCPFAVDSIGVCIILMQWTECSVSSERFISDCSGCLPLPFFQCGS